MPCGQEFGHMETDIVAVFLVGLAWIAQADDEFHGRVRKCGSEMVRK